jgi:hypothetical protein
MTTLSSSDAPLTRRELLLVLLATAAFYLIPYPYYDWPSSQYKLDNPNEVTRVYSARAIGEFGHLYINDVLDEWPTRRTDLSGRPRTPDEPATHPTQLIYPAKSPGMAMLAAPSWWAFHKVSAAVGHETTRHDLVRVCRLTAQALILLLSLLLYAFLRRALSSKYIAQGVYWAMTLGSIGYAYTLIFASHQLATYLLLAFFITVAARPAPSSIHATRGEAIKYAIYWLAGLAGGFAVAAEYSALLPALALGAYAAWRGSDAPDPERALLPRLLHARRHLFVALAGVAVPAALAISYHKLGFGSATKTAYHFMLNPVFRARMEQSAGGFKLPDPDLTAQIYLGATNGLLVFTPLLALAPLGLAYSLHDRRYRAEALAALGVIASLTFYLSSAAFDWRGGWSIGARYMTNVIPALALLAAYGLDRLWSRSPAAARVLLASTAIASIFATAPPSAVFPHLPDDLVNPLHAASLGFIRTLAVPPNNLSLPPAIFGPLLYAAFAAPCLWLLIAHRPAHIPRPRHLLHAAAAAAAAALLIAALIHLAPIDHDASTRFLAFIQKFYPAR